MWVLVVFAAAAALALLEARRSAYRDGAEWRQEVRISLALGAAAAILDAILPNGGFGAEARASVALGVLIFLADDLLYYVSHRLSHRVNLFWASHAVHHSPVRYDFFTGLRQPPTWVLTPAAVAPVILLSLGAPLVLVAISAGIRGVHHFIIHTERVRRFPRLIELVFNTPSHHRVHHGTESYCIDRNFGGVLIIWDRFFGTFADEKREGVESYGLLEARPTGAWQVFIAPWRTLRLKLRDAPNASAKLRALIGPPTAKRGHHGVMASPMR
jgi:sterol desaturase/sphingolipid hydroxylase (fatty acid hydroxylase superfamily)